MYDISRLKYLAKQTVDPSGGAWLVHLLFVAFATASTLSGATTTPGANGQNDLAHWWCVGSEEYQVQMPIELQ